MNRWRWMDGWMDGCDVMMSSSLSRLSLAGMPRRTWASSGRASKLAARNASQVTREYS